MAEVDAIFVDVPLVAGTVLRQGIKRFKKLSVKGMIYIQAVLCDLFGMVK